MYSKNQRNAVRRCYVFDQQPLERCAAAHKMSITTVARWKREALAEGDDWDRAKGAYMMAGGGLEDVVRQTLAVVVVQVQATVQALRDAEDLPPSEKVSMLASLADAYNKLMAASRRLMPETDVLALRLDTLKKLADYVRARHPQSAPTLLAALEGFGEELARGS